LVDLRELLRSPGRPSIIHGRSPIPSGGKTSAQSRRRKRSRRSSSPPSRSRCRNCSTISKAPALKCLRRAQHINVGYDVSNADITGLAGWVLAVRIRRARVRWRGSSTTVRADPIKVLTTRDAVASVTSRSKTRSTPRYPPYGVIPRQAERIRRRSRMPSSIPSRSSRKRSSPGGRSGHRSCAHRTGRCLLDFAASPHLHGRRRFCLMRRSILPVY